MLVAQGGTPGPGAGSPQASPRPDTQPAAATDSAARDDSARAARRARHETLRAERTIPLTPALLASAYDGERVRSLIDLARTARSADDSSLRRYDATSLEQLTVRMSIGSLGRDRLLLRQQHAEHVRWQRGLGAIVEVTGARNAMPMLPADASDIEDNEAIALPYVPGRRTLSMGGERNDTTSYTDIDDVIDPLAPGAEAYYRYSLGDSETIRTPARGGGQLTIHLREVQLHARHPLWNIGTGSLWLDATTGHLVRAVYRFSAPMDIVAIAKDADPHTFDDVPFWVKPLIMPMTANISVITLDYRLLDGKYWLPVSRYADGEGRASAFRVPVRWEVHYRYTAINGPDTLPRLPELTDTTTPGAHDTAHLAVSPIPTPNPQSPTPSPQPPTPNSQGHAELAMRSGMTRPDDSDSTRRRSRETQCAHQATWQRVEIHDGGAARVLVSTPCDTAALARSPDLPGSVYDDAGEAMSHADLLKALRGNAVPDWSPRPVVLQWGPRDGLIRYNRIEGLSAGLAVTDELGLGLSARAEARIGVADLQPNGALSLTRTSPWGTVTLGAYRRLNSANDWGDPLRFGSSIWNFLVGDDEGVYYRSWGAELSGTESEGPLPFSWRLFTEHDWGASPGTHFDVTGVFGGATMPLRNIGTPSGTITGLAFRARPTWGLDPDGFQLATDMRGEGAGGTYTYIRGAADITLSHPVAPFLEGAITASGGTSAGEVPPQREWYLGGLRTIRGLAPGTASGDAYWMTHLEVTTRSMFVRPIVFYDLGWAGDRNNWTHEGRLLNGAGIGASMMDGLFRIDVGKGIWPTHSVRVNAYLQGTF